MEHYFELGYLALFLVCFLAATVLPFSSEVFFGLMLASTFDPLLSLIAASLGNWLGGMSSYALGHLGKTDLLSRWFRIPKAKVLSLESRVQRYGAWSALLCWAPVIGDPIAVALGFFRVRMLPVATLMLVGKTARYAVIAGMFFAAS